MFLFEHGPFFIVRGRERVNLILLFQSDFKDGFDDIVHIGGARKEHIQSVCKAGIGDELKVGLFNGLMGKGVVIGSNETRVELKVSLNQNPPPPLPLTLIVALPRPKSLKKALEVTTSLGVKKIFIIESWRVEKSYWNSPALQKKHLQNCIVSGLEQARDTVAPHIEIRRRFKPFVEDELPALIEGTRALVAHPYNASLCPCALKNPVTLVVGPEGGFIPYEIELLKSLGLEAVTLGERILRVEYAIAALIGRLF